MIEGLKPGLWSVEVNDGSGVYNRFPRLRIPTNASDPFPCRLVLADSSITGTLYDAQTGQPFQATRPSRWYVYAHDLDKDCSPGLFSGTDVKKRDFPPNRFSIQGLKSGTYQIIVRAEGYEQFHSAVFSLTDGQAMDLGKIHMTPCGYLKLKVVDGEGERIDFEAYFDGERLRGSYTAQKGEGLFEMLPVGATLLTVRADGFSDFSKKINLKPAEPLEIRVEMKKK